MNDTDHLAPINTMTVNPYGPRRRKGAPSFQVHTFYDKAASRFVCFAVRGETVIAETSLASSSYFDQRKATTACKRAARAKLTA